MNQFGDDLGRRHVLIWIRGAARKKKHQKTYFRCGTAALFGEYYPESVSFFFDRAERGQVTHYQRWPQRATALVKVPRRGLLDGPS